MGAGASAHILFDVATELSLSHEQRQVYRAYYLELSQAGMNENRIREKLVAKYKADKSFPLTPEELFATRKLQPLSKEEIVMKANNLRRSSVLSSTDQPIKNNDSLTSYQCNGNSNSEEAGDKLSCKICKTSFKTEALLERHVKYSYMHSRTVQDLEAAEKGAARAKRVAIMIHESIQAVRKLISQRNYSARGSKAKRRWLWAYEKVKNNIAIAKTTEMLKDYYRSILGKSACDQNKLLYDGSKLFWRSQLSIEVHMYLHDSDETKREVLNNSPIIEVACFDAMKYKEFPRLYINYFVIRDHIKLKILDALMMALQLQQGDDAASTRPLAFVYNIEKLDNAETKIMNQTIADYIVSKLEIQSHPNRPTQRILTLTGATDDVTSLHRDITAREGDMSTETSLSLPQNTLVDEATVLKAVKPLDIVRRRRTTAAERSFAFEDFNRHTSEIANLTARAAQHALLAREGSVKKLTTVPAIDESMHLDNITEMMSQLLNDTAASASSIHCDTSEPQSEARTDNFTSSQTKTVSTSPRSKTKITNGGTGVSPTRTVTRSLDSEALKSYMQPVKSLGLSAGATSFPITGKLNQTTQSLRQSPTPRSAVTSKPGPPTAPTPRNELPIVTPGPTPRSLSFRAAPSANSIANNTQSQPLSSSRQQHKEETRALRELVRESSINLSRQNSASKDMASLSVTLPELVNEVSTCTSTSGGARHQPPITTLPLNSIVGRTELINGIMLADPAFNALNNEDSLSSTGTISSSVPVPTPQRGSFRHAKTLPLTKSTLVSTDSNSARLPMVSSRGAAASARDNLKTQPILRTQSCNAEDNINAGNVALTPQRRVVKEELATELLKNTGRNSSRLFGNFK